MELGRLEKSPKSTLMLQYQAVRTLHKGVRLLREDCEQ